MFRKFALSLLLMGSFAWIIYAAIHIVNASEKLTPENLFSSSDGQVIVLHQWKEISLSDSVYTTVQSNSLALQIIQIPERIQHIYISSKRKNLLLERSKPWTAKGISTYLQQLSLNVNFDGSNSFHTQTEWKGKYNGKQLVLYTSSFPKEEKTTINWEYIDQKASASFVDFNSGITNVYSLSQSSVKYISQTNKIALPLIDDQSLFQGYIPQNFSSYTFHETNWLKSESKQISPIFDWLSSGICKINFDNREVYVADFKEGQQPISVLEAYISENSEVGNENDAELTNCILPNQIQLNEVFHIRIFNNRAFLSNDKKSIDALIGSYESGNTLEQNAEQRISLFASTPKAVSYRFFNQEKHITKSNLENSTHTVEEFFAFDNKKKNAQNTIPSVQLSGAAIQILPIQNSSDFYVITNSAEVYFFQNGSVAWSKKMTGKLDGGAILSNHQLIVPCETHIEIFQRNGSSANTNEGNRIQSQLKNCIYKGESLLFYAQNNILKGIELNGKEKFSVAIQGIEAKSDLAFSLIKGELILHYFTSTAWKQVNLSRKRELNNLSILNGSWAFVKTDGKVSVVGISNKQFVKVAATGQKATLIGNIQQIIRRNSSDESELFYMKQQQELYILNGKGTVLSQFKTNLREISDAFMGVNQKGQKIVAVLDGLSNNCYLYTPNGNEVDKKSYESSHCVVLQKRNLQKIVMITSVNNYLIQMEI